MAIWWYITAVWSRILQVFLFQLRAKPLTVSASRWNEDVLYHIFSSALSQDLLQAALVCRDWSPTARRLLYSRIFFDSDAPNASALARTLRTCPHLRKFVRFLSVTSGLSTRDATIFDWLELIPEHGLREVTVKLLGRNDQFAQLVLQSPAVRTTPSLIIRGFFATSPEILCSCLELPSLERISFHLQREWGPIALNPTAKLRRLSIGAYRYYYTIGHLLAVFGPHLDHIDIDITGTGVSEDEVEDLVILLPLHAGRIRTLAFQSYQLPFAPFIDDLVERLPCLLHLHCGYGSYSSALFDQLPHRLRTLQLDGNHRHPFPAQDIIRAIDRVGAGKSELEALSVVVQCHGHHNELTDVAHSCERNGVSFRILTVGRADILTTSFACATFEA
ncbi:hypothetical protein BKA93DRAFT_490055 [Sparassis latifolia]